MIRLLEAFNEAITAAIVIVSVSLLLYNLWRNSTDRVRRASAVLLGCVTVVYVGDVFVAISTSAPPKETWLRIEWIGIAFAPAALFHISDALLATTGLISRGRRRRVVRILYIYAMVFLLLAAFTELIVEDLRLLPLPMLTPGPLFILYAIYFAASTLFSFNNVLRARRRSLTKASHRRLTYLLPALMMPAVGLFPYSALFPEPSRQDTVFMWLLVNLGNLAVAFMIIFLAYPLSFFGTNKPERVIRTELLSFMLRGPVTAIAVLVVILFVPRLDVFGLPGSALMPFIAVATVLFFQWMIAIFEPVLERALVYTDDQDQARRLMQFSERLLTRTDARQLLEGILAAICDYLRVPSAFVASINGEVRIEQSVGVLLPAGKLELPELPPALPDSAQVPLTQWQSYWLVPLYTMHTQNTPSQNGTGVQRAIGVIGIWARSNQPDLQAEEHAVFASLSMRAAEVLDDLRIQAELLERVEDVIEDELPVRIEYQPPTVKTAGSFLEQEEFIEIVHEALKHYWGGSRLVDERLLQLRIVTDAMQKDSANAAQAVRTVLSRAIERLKPKTPRSMIASEWTLYNILDLRFVQGKRVKDVAPQMAMGDANFYRKQRVAIEALAQEIREMERQQTG